METESNTKPLDLVLLVDDDETTNYINKRVLSKAGIAKCVDVVTNGEEALAYLENPTHPETSGSYPAPDLMFVDIKMSVMDGFEFLDHYQKLSEDKKAKRLIMLSSSASFYDLHRLEQYPDVIKHIAKPLTAAHLQQIMEEYFSEKLS